MELDQAREVALLSSSDLPVVVFFGSHVTWPLSFIYSFTYVNLRFALTYTKFFHLLIPF